MRAVTLTNMNTIFDNWNQQFWCYISSRKTLLYGLGEIESDVHLIFYCYFFFRYPWSKQISSVWMMIKELSRALKETFSFKASRLTLVRGDKLLCLWNTFIYVWFPHCMFVSPLQQNVIELKSMWSINQSINDNRVGTFLLYFERNTLFRAVMSISVLLNTSMKIRALQSRCIVVRQLYSCCHLLQILKLLWCVLLWCVWDIDNSFLEINYCS